MYVHCMWFQCAFVNLYVVVYIPFMGDRFLPQLVKASFVDALAEVGIKPSVELIENGYQPVVCKSG